MHRMKIKKLIKLMILIKNNQLDAFIKNNEFDVLKENKVLAQLLH